MGSSKRQQMKKGGKLGCLKIREGKWKSLNRYNRTSKGHSSLKKISQKKKTTGCRGKGGKGGMTGRQKDTLAPPKTRVRVKKKIES